MLLFAYIFILVFISFALFVAQLLVLEIKNTFMVLILNMLIMTTFFFALLKIGAQIAAIL